MSRATRCYTDTFSLWAPSDPVIGVDKGVSDLTWPATATATGVAGHLEATPNVNEPAAAGGTKVSNIFTDDKFHFPTSVTVGTGWLIKLTTTGHPLSGQFWVVQGMAEVKAWRAGKQMVYGVMTPAPAGVS
jgi:hypothetical protein